MEVASISSKGAGAAETEQHKAQGSTRRLEAEVKRLSNSLADLTFIYRPVTLVNAQKEIMYSLCVEALYRHCLLQAKAAWWPEFHMLYSFPNPMVCVCEGLACLQSKTVKQHQDM